MTIPAEMTGFARERVTQAGAWLDQILASTHKTTGNPDEPLAVCALADILEHTWPEGIDPHDVIALAARRITDATKPPRRRPRGWGQR